jgi:Tfp pilus assembly protein PilV
VTAMAAHHARVAVALLLLAVGVLGHAVALAVRVRLRGAHSRERATEASSATLEVGETAARASPVAGTRAVLGRRERSEERWAARWLRASSAVENARRGRGDLDGAVVESAAVHAERLGGLKVMVSDVALRVLHC